MLVLSRRKKESIQVLDRNTGTTLRITVVEIGSGKVRIGIDAPEHVEIWRTELLEDDQD